MVSINEKSKLIKIIQKEQLTEEDKEELRHILSKLPSEELKSLLGKRYELFIKNYVNISDSRESTTEIVNSENEQKVIKKTDKSFPLNVPNFKEKTMSEIRRLIPLLEATVNQKELILEKAEGILDQHISRAIRGDITIRKDANPLTNAAAIIYAVLVSNENMPIISVRKISKMVRVSHSAVVRLYNLWYKNLAKKLEFDFHHAYLANCRKILSLYFFELLIDNEIDLYKLVSHLKEISTLKLVSHLKEIIISANKDHNLLKQLTEKETKTLQNIATNYPDSFTKYFSDLVDIIKLLIISNKSHKIIGADFSVKHFTKFLMNMGVGLFFTDNALFKIIGEIFKFLKNTKYLNLFPVQMQSEYRTNARREKIVGNKIKLFIMKYIHKGNYFDYKTGLATCPECLIERLKINTSSPRIRSKEFHHESTKIEGYSAKELFSLFTKNRGNPHFLLKLIKDMEKEKVTLICSCHHQIVNAIHFNNFRKLIIWEDIPKNFPQDIFVLPAEIIRALVMVCVDNIPSHILKPLKRRKFNSKIFDLKKRREEVRGHILYHLKRRYMIDRTSGGVCPVCGEFNTREHLPAFDFGHLYELKELTPIQREQEQGIRKKIKGLIESLPCSGVVEELERQQGAFICRNCHRILHEDMGTIDMIYDNQNVIKKFREDSKETNIRFKLNLVRNSILIKDPLKLEKVKMKLKPFVQYLKALYELSESKPSQDGVTRNEMLSYLKLKNYKYIFENHRVSEKYLEIRGDQGKTIKYYINNEGKRIVRLMYYFEAHYQRF